MGVFHTISILVTNESGVLSRVVDLFSGRGYNIESLTVAPTIDRLYSRITIVTDGDNAAIEQINKQLNRLIPVIKVADLNLNEALECEVALLKLNCKDEEKSDILRIVDATNSKIIDVTDNAYTIQTVGSEKQIQALAELIKPYGVKEFVRSGKIAMSKGNQFVNIKNLQFIKLALWSYFCLNNDLYFLLNRYRVCKKSSEACFG